MQKAVREAFSYERVITKIHPWLYFPWFPVNPQAFPEDQHIQYEHFSLADMLLDYQESITKDQFK
jgi:hypothetical protein